MFKQHFETTQFMLWCDRTDRMNMSGLCNLRQRRKRKSHQTDVAEAKVTTTSKSNNEHQTYHLPISSRALSSATSKLSKAPTPTTSTTSSTPSTQPDLQIHWKIPAKYATQKQFYAHF
jgi:hypothetical protein